MIEEILLLKNKKIYKKLAQNFLEKVKKINVNLLAKKGIVTREEIERMLKNARTDIYTRKPKNFKRLGIDEIALTKGKRKK